VAERRAARGAPAPAAVLAVDGGNSKAEVVLVARDGRLLGFSHGPTISHQQVGLDAGMARLVEQATALAAASGVDGARRPLADVMSCCLAGADFPAEVRRLEGGLAGTGLGRRTFVHNDTFGALRAGATRRFGVVLVCGHGINAAAIGRDGRSARFDAVGEYSGDWGGGHGVASAGLAAAVRADDGRGPATALEDRVARHFGRRTIGAVVRDLYYERSNASHERYDGLAPLVFDTAAEGDVVARAIVDRLADELVAMATALIRRTRLERADPEVVLAGGVFRTRERGFYQRLEQGIRRVAPAATLLRLELPPVLGAALMGLEQLGLDPGALDAAEARLRRDLAARTTAEASGR
jgi:N-acetylglucosamine kinase-like BadF-type ATPase